MKAALFGKRIDKTNIGKLVLFINNLKEYSQMEFCYHDSFYGLISEFSHELPQGAIFSSYHDLPKDTDLFLSLGGDGTFLKRGNNKQAWRLEEGPELRELQV